MGHDCRLHTSDSDREAERDEGYELQTVRRVPRSCGTCDEVGAGRLRARLVVRVGVGAQSPGRVRSAVLVLVCRSRS